MDVEPGVTLMYEENRHNFPCPLWYDIEIEDWWLGSQGTYILQAWLPDHIARWEKNNRLWSRFLPLSTTWATKKLHEYLVQSGKLQPPGPRHNVLLSNCSVDTIEINFVESIICMNIPSSISDTDILRSKELRYLSQERQGVQDDIS